MRGDTDASPDRLLAGVRRRRCWRALGRLGQPGPPRYHADPSRCRGGRADPGPAAVAGPAPVRAGGPGPAGPGDPAARLRRGIRPAAGQGGGGAPGQRRGGQPCRGGRRLDRRDRLPGGPGRLHGWAAHGHGAAAARRADRAGHRHRRRCRGRPGQLRAPAGPPAARAARLADRPVPGRTAARGAAAARRRGGGRAGGGPADPGPAARPAVRVGPPVPAGFRGRAVRGGRGGAAVRAAEHRHDRPRAACPGAAEVDPGHGGGEEQRHLPAAGPLRDGRGQHRGGLPDRADHLPGDLRRPGRLGRHVRRGPSRAAARRRWRRRRGRGPGRRCHHPRTAAAAAATTSCPPSSAVAT